MVTYVVLARFTDQGVKNAKDSSKRAEAFKQMAETFGVTVNDIFWTQGRYDIVIVIEAPDELSATALNLSLSALGNIRTESLRAFSSTDILRENHIRWSRLRQSAGAGVRTMATDRR